MEIELMIWFMLMQLFTILLQGLWLRRKTEREKDLEILLLRRQLAILERQHKKPMRVSRADKLTLTVLATQFRSITGWPMKQLGTVLRIVQPETVFKWHRELVRRKWTFQQHSRGGRPPTTRDLERLIVRLARETPDWGNGKIQGELLKLGHELSDETVANILKRHGIPPAPERHRSPSWQPSEGLKRAEYPNHVWSYDFMSGRTERGNKVRILNILDEYTRECLMILVAPSIPAKKVIQALDWLFLTRGAPAHLRSDNGPEFIAYAIQDWLKARQCQTIYITPGSPWENPFIESFNGHFRSELLDRVLFANGHEAKQLIEQWRLEYNHQRPHSRLGYLTPAEFAAQVGAAQHPPASVATLSL